MLTGRETWIPDEVITAGRENLDPDHVARYDDKMDATAADEVAMLLDLGLPEVPTVIDLGAGTGQFTLAMSEHAGRVFAVDVSPVMLERLRAKVSVSGVANVECVRGGFLTYEHTGAPADLVYSRYALHHLPDFWKAVALTRLADMARPGGLLRLWDVVYSFDPPEAMPVLDRWFDGLESDDVNEGWLRAELEEHVRDEHSTFTWLFEPMIERAGFTIEAADYSADHIDARYLCRRR
jgi:ubiquinone/menaquinone biosynthesis C-methylase UbiE